MRNTATASAKIFMIVSCGTLVGCGTVAPQMTEAWEPREVDTDLAYRIKRSIVCELIHAIINTNVDAKHKNGNDFDVIPMEYGVQLQTTLTIEENTALNPSLAYNQTLRNASAMGVTVGQMFNLGAGATLSSTATRIDTSYSYFVVGKLVKNLSFCDPKYDENDKGGHSPFLQSNLGIERYLINNVKAADAIYSSTPNAGKKDARLDIYSYDLKFVVVSNGSLNPVWKLVGISADTGSLPFLSGGRTRTHELLVTFGPNSAKGFDIALQTHFNTQLVHRTSTGNAL